MTRDRLIQRSAHVTFALCFSVSFDVRTVEALTVAAPSPSSRLEGLLREIQSELQYEPATGCLSYHGGNDDASAEVVVTEERACEWLRSFGEVGLEVFGGPAEVAAVKLALVDIDEDLALGMDPFSSLR